MARPAGTGRRIAAAQGGVTAALVTTVFVVITLVAPTTQLTSIMLIGFYTVATCGLNIIVGRLGLITIGHGATVGISAFLCVYLLEQGQPLLVSTIVAVLVSSVIGLPLVAVSFRLDGLFFGIVSLAYLIVTLAVLHLITPLSGGARGVVTPLVELGGIQLYDYRNAALVIAVAVGLALGVALFLTRASTGLQWDAIRMNPGASESLGISVVRRRISGYLAGSLIGALAGPIYALAVGALTTEQFGLRMSLAFLLISVIGSPASVVIGPILGSAVYVLLPELLKAATGSNADAPVYSQILISVSILLLLVMRYSGLKLSSRLHPRSTKGLLSAVQMPRSRTHTVEDRRTADRAEVER